MKCEWCKKHMKAIGFGVRRCENCKMTIRIEFDSDYE